MPTSPRARFGLRFLAPLLLFLLSASAPAVAHEPPNQRAVARRLIDPKQSFQFLVLSGAGGHFHSLRLSPGLRTLFAGTHLGLFRSEDRGLTWRLAAARFSGEEIHGLAREPKTGTLYVTTHGQGLLLSRDGGKSWSDRANGLPGRDLHALALDRRTRRILFVWVVAHGLYRSDDGGGRWSSAANAQALAGVESLAIHPDNSGRFYAGTARGVWLSNDGGKQWRFPEGGLPHRTAGVALPPWRSDLLLAATLEGAFTGRADGTGWKRLLAPPAWWGLPIGFDFLAAQPDVLFTVTHEGVVAALRLAGGEWTPVANLPQE